MSKKFFYSSLSIKSIGENGVFSGYASVFNIVDKQNDLILPGAFKENLNKNKIKLLWQHDPGEPIGNIALFIIIRTDYNMLLAYYSHKHISYHIWTIMGRAIS